MLGVFGCGNQRNQSFVGTLVLTAIEEPVFDKQSNGNSNSPRFFSGTDSMFDLSRFLKIKNSADRKEDAQEEIKEVKAGEERL